MRLNANLTHLVWPLNSPFWQPFAIFVSLGGATVALALLLLDKGWADRWRLLAPPHPVPVQQPETMAELPSTQGAHLLLGSVHRHFRNRGLLRRAALGPGHSWL